MTGAPAKGKTRAGPLVSQGDKLFTGHTRMGRNSGLYHAGARFYPPEADRPRALPVARPHPAAGREPVRLRGEQPAAVYGRVRPVLRRSDGAVP